MVAVAAAPSAPIAPPPSLVGHDRGGRGAARGAGDIDQHQAHGEGGALDHRASVPPAPTVVTALHAYYSPARLERVLALMAQLGAPRIRAHLDEATGAWFAREGTHRLRAALALGVAPILCPIAWWRSRRALQRARFAAAIRGHAFPSVEVARA